MRKENQIVKPTFSTEVSFYHMVSPAGEILEVLIPAYPKKDNARHLSVQDENIVTRIQDENSVAEEAIPEKFSLALFYPECENTLSSFFSLPIMRVAKHKIPAFPLELANSASCPFFYDNLLFFTREHAFYYGKLLFLRDVVFDLGEPERMIIDQMIPRLIVGDVNALVTGKEAKKQVNQLFDQLCETKLGAITTEDINSGHVNQITKSNWASVRVNCMLTIWREYCLQYPALKILLLNLWEHHALPIEATEDENSWCSDSATAASPLWQLATTEVILRLILEWKQIDFSERWFTALKGRFNSQFLLTKKRGKADLRTACVIAGRIPISYSNFPVDLYFMPVLIANTSVLQAELYHGKSSAANLKGELATAFLLRPQNAEMLKDLVSDCLPAGSLLSEKSELPFKLLYFKNQKNRNPGVCKFLFNHPALAKTFRKRFCNRFGLSEKNVVLENVAFQASSIDEVIGYTDYRFAVSLAATHPQQLDDFIEFSRDMIYLFPYFGAVCWQLSGELLQLDINQPFIEYLSLQCEVNSLAYFKGRLLKCVQSVKGPSSYQTAFQNLNDLFQKHFTVYSAAHFSPVGPEHFIPEYFILRLLAWGSFYPIQIHGDLAERDQMRIMSWLYQYDNASTHISHRNSATAQYMQRAMSAYGLHYQANENLQPTWHERDYHRNIQIDVIPQQSIESDQRSVGVFYWDLTPIDLTNLKQHLCGPGTSDIPQIPGNTLSKNFLLHGVVTHLIDSDAGVYYQQKKHQFVMPSVVFRSAPGGYINTQLQKEYRIFTKKVFDFPQSKQVQLYNDCLLRYRALFTLAAKCGIQWLTMTVDSRVEAAGLFKRQIYTIMAKALIDTIAALPPSSLHGILIAAPIVNGDSRLYSALSQQQQLSLLDEGPQRSRIVVIADIHPRDLAHFAVRYLANAPVTANSPEVIVGEVIPESAMTLPGFPFHFESMQRINMRDQSQAADSTAALVFHPALNPYVYTLDATYQRIQLPAPEVIAPISSTTLPLAAENAKMVAASTRAATSTSTPLTSATTTPTSLPKARPRVASVDDDNDADLDDKPKKQTHQRSPTTVDVRNTSKVAGFGFNNIDDDGDDPNQNATGSRSSSMPAKK